MYKLTAKLSEEWRERVKRMLKRFKCATYGELVELALTRLEEGRKQVSIEEIRALVNKLHEDMRVWDESFAVVVEMLSRLERLLKKLPKTLYVTP